MSFNSETAKINIALRKLNALSQAYQQLSKDNYHLNLRLDRLQLASYSYDKDLRIGKVVIFDDLRPVKILAGFSKSQLIGQFLDRIDTPIRLLDVRRLWTAEKYSSFHTRHAQEMEQAFGEFHKLSEEKPNSIEDSWW